MTDVSVIIPCYNMRDYIGATIESALAQRHPVREVLVIDDGSTDDSAMVVESLAARHPDKVRLIRQANAGESRARNVGIDQARGAMVAFLDADDIWLPDKIAQQVRLLDQHPQAAGCHTRVFNFRQQLDDMDRQETEKTMDDPTIAHLIRYHWVCPSSLMVRRSVLLEYGVRFDEKIQHSEDMLFAADLRRVGPLRLVDQLLVAKRVHHWQQSRSAWHPIRSIESRLIWCRQNAQRLEPQLAEMLEQELGQQLVTYLEHRYWRRQIRSLEAMCRQARQLCPQAMAESFLASRRIWPRWVYRMRDALMS